MGQLPNPPPKSATVSVAIRINLEGRELKVSWMSDACESYMGVRDMAFIRLKYVFRGCCAVNLPFNVSLGNDSAESCCARRRFRVFYVGCSCEKKCRTVPGVQLQQSRLE